MLILFGLFEHTLHTSKLSNQTIKLFGLRWQGVPSKNVSEEYRVRFSGEQTLVSAHASTHEPN